MASSRASKEEKILDYFRTESLPTAKAILGLAKAEVKKRESADSAAPAPGRAARKRGPNKKKPSPNASSAPGSGSDVGTGG